MLKFIAKILIFGSMSFVVHQSYADEVATFYDVDVLVASESASARTQAFEQGLDEVFIRISGDSAVMSKLKRPLASRYVKQFSYGPVTRAMTDAKGNSLTHNLKIQYNGHSMAKYLLDNGLPVWDRRRPDVVVWLVVRDGKNEYVLKGTDKSLLKAATDKALTRRGIPERWPLYDAEDKKILSVSDIRGGFKRPVIQASKRYSNGPALTGSIIWNGKRWQSNWDLVMGAENRHWNLDDSNYNRLINKAIDQVADALGMAYAMQDKSGNQQLTTVQLDIQSVNSIEKYRYIENYLSTLAAVENTRTLTVDGQNVSFEVTLRRSTEDFLNLIKNDKAFTEVNVRAPVKPMPQHAGVVVTDGVQPKDIVSQQPAPGGNNIMDIVTPAPVEQVPVYRYRLMK